MKVIRFYERWSMLCIIRPLGDRRWPRMREPLTLSQKCLWGYARWKRLKRRTTS